MNLIRKRVKKSRLQLLHQYYVYTGFYSFLKVILQKSILPIFVFILAILGIHFLVMDLNEIFSYVIENFHPVGIFAVFFASESILGLIPPEIFIAWTAKTDYSWFFLTILALLSYFGGIVSYFAGRTFAYFPAVYEFLEVKMAKHVKNMRKWGGLLIIVGALLPVPFSITSVAAGLIKYPLTNYLLYGLLRIVRFAIYGVMIFKVID
ncbi:MAG: short-chain dehydrogenase [Flavobacteriales bacterium CG18_big_fil_WC_8_21_14_2_50_32_9]|nr:short-chain dehydrogenase [Flavobacteriales bacterium]PIQ16495.1 MAG: short-chain dehydrogenase [Flavobacteriales bacterium CG18_big_fil_WC_8_21_14_2_50_32_9]PJC62033.1 MAG: short-chain dehydrogenase [Flavobacteriales bacterium CG_4_9_14_0_2_um_filter_32_27]